MSFYTSVVRYGNYMLYRGYDNSGKRVVKKDLFQPKFYIPAKKDTGWKGLNGQMIGSVEFPSMREARSWLEKYDGVQGFNIYGSTNYIHQYITKSFQEILSLIVMLSTLVQLILKQNMVMDSLNLQKQINKYYQSHIKDRIDHYTASGVTVILIQIKH